MCDMKFALDKAEDLQRRGLTGVNTALDRILYYVTVASTSSSPPRAETLGADLTLFYQDVELTLRFL